MSNWLVPLLAGSVALTLVWRHVRRARLDAEQPAQPDAPPEWNAGLASSWSPRLFRAFAAVATIGLGVMVALHVQALRGQWYPQVEWPVRICSGVVLLGAVMVTPRGLNRRLWSVAWRVIPRPALAAVAVLCLYCTASFISLDMLQLPARGSFQAYRVFTADFMLLWALTALLLYVAAAVREGQ